MKLEVGMWVLTTDRKEIGRITHICDCEQCRERGFLEPVVDNVNIGYITKFDKEHGFHGYKFYDNAIDFIQVGDYVNGYLIIRKEKTLLTKQLSDIEPRDIKSIVTKEQMEAMAYKVV